MNFEKLIKKYEKKRLENLELIKKHEKHDLESAKWCDGYATALSDVLRDLMAKRKTGLQTLLCDGCNYPEVYYIDGENEKYYCLDCK